MSGHETWGWAPRGESSTWHAYRRPQALEKDGITWCGLRGLTAELQTDPPARPWVCRNCRQALSRGRPYRPHGPVPADARVPRRYLGGTTCPCHECRKGRWRVAHVGLARLIRQVRAQACNCVRKWSEAQKYVGETENQLMGFLLAWEMTGDPDARIDVKRTERLYLAAWRWARREFEARGETHSCAGTPR